MTRHLGASGFRCSRMEFISVFIVLVIMLPGAVTISSSPVQATSAQTPGYQSVPGLPAPNIPPTAIATPSHAEIRAGEKLILSGEQSYDPDGEIVAYRWSFSEGSSIEGFGITVQFSTTGTKTALLTITDDDGAQASAYASIDVVQPPPQPMLLLSAGPINVFEITPGNDAVIELQLAAINQRATDLKVVIVDDGGLDVEPPSVPWSLNTSETTTLRLRIHAPTDLRGPVGTTIRIKVQSDQTVSNVERIEVTIPAGQSFFSLQLEFLEMIALLALAVIACAALKRWRRP